MLSPGAREFRTAYLFLLPAGLLLVVFYILPTIRARRRRCRRRADLHPPGRGVRELRPLPDPAAAGVERRHQLPHPYEAAVRVPLLLRWPGRTEAGRVCPDLVTLIDLLPTLLAELGLAYPGSVAQRVTPAPTPPNILWICTDQQRADTISALGNPHIRTPMLDSLVRDGVALRNAYCQSPICSPSRASFMTGRYPSSIRATAKRAGAVGRRRAAGVQAARERRLRLPPGGQTAPVARRGPGGSARRRRLPDLSVEPRTAAPLGRRQRRQRLARRPRRTAGGDRRSRQPAAGTASQPLVRGSGERLHQAGTATVADLHEHL